MMDYKLWFSMVNLSDKVKIELTQEYKDCKNIFENFETIIKKNKYINNKLTEYNKFNEMNKIKLRIEYLTRNNINFINYFDEEYPQDLRNIQNPPYTLFYIGNIDLLKERKVAIVGARNCTNYGIAVTKQLTKLLNSYNISIISGGAKGIDSETHKTSVELNKSTIVVLGCGVDVIYPKSNYHLFEEIKKSGLIISEFIPGTPPNAYNFPQRNRIISALSELVLVIEASEKSGSLITANYAADQGKDVMVVPGPINSKNSLGCNKLIRDGAQILTCQNDLFTKLKLDALALKRRKTQVAKKILAIIGEEPTHFDRLLKNTNVDRMTLIKVLFEMQIENEIVSLPGNYYCKII